MSNTCLLAKFETVPRVSVYVELLRRNPDYRNLWLARVVSNFGDWFNLLASAALITSLTGSGTAISYLFLARFLPVFVMSPFAGVLADRYRAAHDHGHHGCAAGRHCAVLSVHPYAAAKSGCSTRSPSLQFLLSALYTLRIPRCSPTSWNRTTSSRQTRWTASPGVPCWRWARFSAGWPRRPGNFGGLCDRCRRPFCWRRGLSCAFPAYPSRRKTGGASPALRFPGGLPIPAWSAVHIGSQPWCKAGGVAGVGRHQCAGDTAGTAGVRHRSRRHSHAGPHLRRDRHRHGLWSAAHSPAHR